MAQVGKLVGQGVGMESADAEESQTARILESSLHNGQTRHRKSLVQGPNSQEGKPYPQLLIPLLMLREFR